MKLGPLLRARSSDRQPAWARPILFALTALAGFLYAWSATGNLEIYYAAAVRSMSMSWHNFFFAAFDPAGTVTLDKLPGAFWVQAVVVRIFGVHAWALVAPQVVEGMASVLVLYHAVRRLAGPLAGIIAATVLVLSPATVLLNRGNISDTLMVLLILLAADSTVTAILTGRLRNLLLAGLWIGLAFQAKMIEAWLILPALALAYLWTGPGRWPRRAPRLAETGLVVAVVSLGWMAVVSAWPASSRPYVDGSRGNSVFSQVFVYNGFGRVDQASPNQLLTKAIGIQLGSAPAGWNRLLTGAYGRDTAWLIPAALGALAACLVVRRDREMDRRFGLTTSAILWGGWLLVLLVVFSASSSINAYYTAALSPPIAGLLGTGCALAWAHRSSAVSRGAVAGGVAVTCAYAAWLLPGSGVGLVAALPVIAVGLGVVAVAVLLVPLRMGPRRRRGAAIAGAVLAGVATGIVPAVASASVVAKGFGPFDTPFEPAAASVFSRNLGGIAKQTESLLPALERADTGQPDLMATQTAAVAAPFIYDTGQEVVPIGGFTGTIPAPTLAQLRAMVARGDFHLVVQAPRVDDPRLIWVAHSCLSLGTGPRTSTGLQFSLYYCGRP